MISKRGKLNKIEAGKVLKGAVVAGVGAVVFYLIDAAGEFDFGSYTPMVVAGLGIAANLIRKVWARNAVRGL